MSVVQTRGKLLAINSTRSACSQIYHAFNSSHEHLALDRQHADPHDARKLNRTFLWVLQLRTATLALWLRRKFILCCNFREMRNYCRSEHVPYGDPLLPSHLVHNCVETPRNPPICLCLLPWCNYSCHSFRRVLLPSKQCRFLGPHRRFPNWALRDSNSVQSCN